MSTRVFAVPVFFICFRESLETAIIISVLLAFLKQTLAPEPDKSIHKKLVKQVWWGVGIGLVICLAIGGGLIGAFYAYGVDHFAGAEDLWEGAFGLIAALIISIMGAALLRVSKLQDKWRIKIARAIEDKDRSKMVGRFTTARFRLWCEKYAMFMLPFITVLREGLEAVVFIGGVGLSLPATAFPLAVVCGFAAGIFVGFLIYKGGNTARMQIFLIISTCFLYLVAAGLFSKAVWSFEANAWSKTIGGDADEVGDGPGSYDIRKSVWHVNCCNPENADNGGGGWGIFNSILGWTNSATIGSVLAYNLYWLTVIVVFMTMRYHEKHGRFPLMKAKSKALDHADASSDSPSRSSGERIAAQKSGDPDHAAASTGVREVEA